MADAARLCNISYWHEGAPTTYEIITNGEECIIEGNLVLAYPLLAALAGSTVIFGLTSTAAAS